MSPFILTAQDQCDIAQVGGKAGALAHLSLVDCHIPEWFVLTPDAFWKSLTAKQGKVFKQKNTDEIHMMVGDMNLAAHVSKEVEEYLDRSFSDKDFFAVRSSAVDEDGSDFSFAGQLESYLFVPTDEVVENIVKVWQSAYSKRIMAYLEENGSVRVPEPPAVLVQRMLSPDSAGVAFAVDPVSGQRGIRVVSAVFGLGNSLVSGDCDADTYRVDRDGKVLSRDIVKKTVRQDFDKKKAYGIKNSKIAKDKQEDPVLTDIQVRQVAELSQKTSKHFGRPQDIEWAIEGEKLYMLQSRPITTLSALNDPDGSLTLWDNSNITESYGGICSPLTFSFAHFVYEEVYRQFCKILLVPKQSIEYHDSTFKQMLGLVNGRVYYNLLSWYRVLALLPGYQVNRRFMEQMMGVKEELPEDLDIGSRNVSYRGKALDLFYLVRTLGGLLWQLTIFPLTWNRFNRRLESALEDPVPSLDNRRPEEIIDHYINLERQLLTRWDAPLINDFFAMFFFGLLQKLCCSWVDSDSKTFQNDLISGEGDIISAEPAKRMRQMAELAAEDSELTASLLSDDLIRMQHQIRKNEEFSRLYVSYLDKFGDRCMEELKLESATLVDNPLPLLRAVGQLAKRPAAQKNESGEGEDDIRLSAEKKVSQTMFGKPIKRFLFNKVLSQARGRIRGRENLRFERTRVFGRVRRVFVEMGKRFHALDLIQDPADIFYLEVREILGFVQGNTTTTDLKGLVELRRRQYDKFRDMSGPDERFETRGIVNHGEDYMNLSMEKIDVSNTDALQGLGCCPGIVRGRLCVITDPRGAEIKDGEIMVAERTDPGWIMLFPACSGLLVERGSLLSHSAIVAREMSIPAVVSIPGLLQWAKTGDLVEMDGRTGTVRRLTSIEDE